MKVRVRVRVRVRVETVVRVAVVPGFRPGKKALIHDVRTELIPLVDLLATEVSSGKTQYASSSPKLNV